MGLWGMGVMEDEGYGGGGVMGVLWLWKKCGKQNDILMKSDSVNT